jgi:hypothetical protein
MSPATKQCARCQVSKPLEEYDEFVVKGGRKKVCTECLNTMRLRRARVKAGLPVPPKRNGPRPKKLREKRKPRPVVVVPDLIPTDGIAWPATTNPLLEVK